MTRFSGRTTRMLKRALAIARQGHVFYDHYMSEQRIEALERELKEWRYQAHLYA